MEAERKKVIIKRLQVSPPTKLDCTAVNYNGKHYIVTKICDRSIVVDLSDFPTISTLVWNLVDGKVVTHRDGENKTIAQLISGNSHVRHINEIDTDFRRENLEVKLPIAKRDRSINLPENSGIDPNEIPTGITYTKASGSFPDHFTVCIKRNSENVFRAHGSKSSKFTLRQRLESAIAVLNEFKQEHPELFNNGDVTAQQLSISYYDILNLTGETVSQPTIQKTTVSNLTKLPPRVRYVKETVKRGDGFEYEDKSGGTRVNLRTTRSKSTSTEEKYKEMLSLLKANGIPLE